MRGVLAHSVDVKFGLQILSLGRWYAALRQRVVPVACSVNFPSLLRLTAFCPVRLTTDVPSSLWLAYMLLLSLSGALIDIRAASTSWCIASSRKANPETQSLLCAPKKVSSYETRAHFEGRE